MENNMENKQDLETNNEQDLDTKIASIQKYMEETNDDEEKNAAKVKLENLVHKRDNYIRHKKRTHAAKMAAQNPSSRVRQLHGVGRSVASRGQGRPGGGVLTLPLQPSIYKQSHMARYPSFQKGVVDAMMKMRGSPRAPGRRRRLPPMDTPQDVAERRRRFPPGAHPNKTGAIPSFASELYKLNPAQREELLEKLSTHSIKRMMRDGALSPKSRAGGGGGGGAVMQGGGKKKSSRKKSKRRKSLRRKSLRRKSLRRKSSRKNLSRRRR